MRIDDVTQAIGKTPLVRLRRLSPAGGATVWAKLEAKNPLGSVKDRPALYMIEDAEREGRISPERTIIVEPTSGNTGIGLAMVCAVKGYRLILTMPETMSLERRRILELLGAELVLTEAALGMRGAVEKAEEIAAAAAASFMPRQFSNPANVKAHRETTAQEILDDMEGLSLDAFVAGMGTGGTLTGVGQALRERGYKARVVAVEPERSSVLAGGEPGPHLIQGIGPGFVPELLDRSVLSEVRAVTDADAVLTARELARQEGLLVGISSGAAAFAAVAVARELGPDQNVVTVLCDTGERYLSTALVDDALLERARRR